MNLKEESNLIINNIINKTSPYDNTFNILKNIKLNTGKLIVISIGKASFTMAKACADYFKDRIYKGIVVTKYNHSHGNINNFTIYEAGHPLVDNNSIKATNKVIELISNLNPNDTVLFLISGGSSSLFEDPLINLNDLIDINNQLLRCGASINEINTIRKRLSKVKGGKLLSLCKGKIINIILSDVVGNKLDDIGSGITVKDTSTSKQALDIVDKYNLNINDEIKELLKIETPKDKDSESYIIGSVKLLCEVAKKECEDLNYETSIVTDELCGYIEDVSKYIGNIARNNQSTNKSLSFIFGGETTVKLKGNGIGGRNEELALLLSKEIKDLKNTCFFSLGSDGSDGVSEAAGGVVDNNTINELVNLNINIDDYLNNNDSYNCLKKINSLIITGPTGNNINDVCVLLIKR